MSKQTILSLKPSCTQSDCRQIANFEAQRIFLNLAGVGDWQTSNSSGFSTTRKMAFLHACSASQKIVASRNQIMQVVSPHQVKTLVAKPWLSGREREVDPLISHPGSVIRFGAYHIGFSIPGLMITRCKNWASSRVATTSCIPLCQMTSTELRWEPNTAIPARSDSSLKILSFVFLLRLGFYERLDVIHKHVNRE